MEKQTMIWVAAQRQLGYRLDQLGLVGSTGIVLVIAALITWFTVVQGEEKELVRLSQGLEALRKQEAVKSSLPSNPILSKEEQLAIFYKGFPDELQVPDLLKEVFQAAHTHDLTFETAEYSLVQTGTERLVRYRVALPVKGAFKPMLDFMDAVLKQNGAIALENASFKRDKVDDAVVDAKLVFVVLVDSRP
jgi:Tfp pilus assembly protein PilO